MNTSRLYNDLITVIMSFVTATDSENFLTIENYLVLMSLKCYYHPEIDAETKCEDCGKYLCLECKQVLIEVHGSSDRRYSTRHELCPICYYDRQIRKYSRNPKISLIMWILFSIPFIAITFSWSSVPGNPMGFVVIFFIAFAIFMYIWLIFVVVYRAPRKIDRFKREREAFINNLSGSHVELRSIKRFCTECGKEIHPDDSVCSHCGQLIEE
jgi:uncharacterized membrane protein